jgi:hypothetical protein
MNSRYAKYRERQLQRAKAYYWQNREAVLARRKGHSQRYRTTVRGRADSLLQQAKRRAAEKNWSFDLTVEWIEERIKRGCELSGLEFDLRNGQGKGRLPRAPSIDRIDSDKGYTQGNCRVVCLAINVALNHWGLAEAAPIWRAVLARVQ